jgi:hypothetical protein
MTRDAALRASALFIVLTVVFGAIGVSTHTIAAEALFLTGASLGLLLLAFGMAVPTRAAVPVRARRRLR